MYFPMRPVDMDFLDGAEKVWVMEARVAAPRADVWRAIADPSVWHEWFPGVEGAHYEGDPPYGIGTVRRARVGGQDMDEVMVCWEEEKRWAYYIRGSSYPLARAQLECTELFDCEGGTLMRWTIAADRGWLLRLATPFFHRTVTRLWLRVAKNLEVWLGSRQSPSNPA